MNTISSLKIRHLLLVISVCAALSTHADTPAPSDASKSKAVQSSCKTQNLREQESVRVRDVVGMYRQKVDLPPHSAFPSDGKPSGYNYLAITSLGDSVLRVRLITKEINGHDCGFDSQALLCGRTIRLLPNEEEKSALEISKQLAPRLQVTKNYIAFTSNADGTVVSGSPYCGNRGMLNKNFKRISRNSQIDSSVFNQ